MAGGRSWLHQGLRGSFAAAVIALALAGTLAAPPSRAVPIGIRARTAVVLEHRRDGRALVLSGRLVDDQAEPIAGENATLEIPGLPAEVRLTDSDGRFEVRISKENLLRLETVHGQRLPWTVRFDGSARLGSASNEGQLDLTKTSTRLTVSITEPEVTRDDRNITLALALTTAAGNDKPTVPIPEGEVRLRVGDGKELVGRTGENGRAAFMLRPTLLAGAGTYEVVARYLGDQEFAGSEGRAVLRVLLPTRVTLRIAREGDEREGRYRFSGRLSDENGPITNAAITVRGVAVPRPPPRKAAPAPPEPAGAVFETVAATGSDGVFVAALPAQALSAHGEQVVVVTASFSPASDDPRHRGSVSRPVNLEIPPPPGVPLGWYAIGLGLVACFAGLAHALRSHLFGRAWAQLVLAFRAFRLRFRRPIGDARAIDADPPFVTRVEDADPTRARGRDVFTGIVVDAHRRTALPFARVSARGAGGALHVAQAGIDGRFTLGPLPSGAWVVRVEAATYLARELAVELPHGGDYDGAYYALVAVKRRMRELFSDATAALGAPVAWGFETPREAAGKAIARAPSPTIAGLPMGELTGLVERAHFAPDGVGEAEIERARVLREELE